MPEMFIKDPVAELDYVFDFKALTNGRGDSDWLEVGETILTKTVTVDSGLTKESDTLTDTNTSITVWLSGGIAGQNYKVTAEIVTSAGRTDKRTATVRVKER